MKLSQSKPYGRFSRTASKSNVRQGLNQYSNHLIQTRNTKDFKVPQINNLKTKPCSGDPPAPDPPEAGPDPPDANFELER